ncbi:hypothetical protein NIES593_19660 [Hydrococcus rivularis NIES-593]|uniref:Uncharacterized protein n=1 Tax=Hydrococcus rivularis NIES-593 TaxID=1921803 RepID=A0A1U7H9K5_9CYAN|nr:hypothetical protein [Hydrococcus rivularis]OKH20215.1 hypothetical protein NIES593_19660 [Hydrococcus rivularis NIES-593]
MTTWVYDVTLTGIVNQQRFQRPGQLVISNDSIVNPQGTSNDVNFWEVGLFSSDVPSLGPANPQGTGAITFVTNNALLGRSPVDTVYEAYDSQTNTVYIGPDPQTLSYGQNQFSSGGLLSTPGLISSGYMALQPQNDNSILGAIDFSGPGGGYQAQFSGTLVQVV